MPGTSSKKPSSKRITFVLREDFIHFVLSVNDLFIVYTSGLLVVIGALLMLGILPFESWQQITLASLILSGLFAVGTTIYAIGVPSPDEIKTKRHSQIAIALLGFSAICTILSWLLILFSTVALIVLIAIA